MGVLVLLCDVRQLLHVIDRSVLLFFSFVQLSEAEQCQKYIDRMHLFDALSNLGIMTNIPTRLPNPDYYFCIFYLIYPK